MTKECDGEGRIWQAQGCMSCKGCDKCQPTDIEKVAHNKKLDEPDGALCFAFDAYEIRLAARCIRLVRDMEKYGTRFDLMPTVAFGPGQRHASEASWYYEYLKRIDDSAKDKAEQALSGDIEEGVAYVGTTRPVTDICCACAKPVGAVGDQCSGCEKWGCCMECLKLHQRDCHARKVVAKKAGKCVCDEPGVGLQKCSLCDWWVCINCGQAHNETVHSTFRL